MPDFRAPTYTPKVPLPPAMNARQILDGMSAHGFHLDEVIGEKLAIYDQQLIKWQKAINLIGPATIDDRLNRHFVDSVQLIKFLPTTDICLADLGSGAGFPGMVLAILGVREVHLVESDIRKATFLREVSRETKTPVTIHDKRVEDCKIEGVDVVTARALATLPDLLAHLTQLAPAAMGLFLKGAQAAEELEKAQKKYQCDAESFDSLTDPEARILRLKNIQ